MLRTFILLSVFLFSLSIEARTVLKDSAKAKRKGRVAVVQISKSNVAAYAKPSFDARIVVRLKKDQKLYGLKKKISGVDGLGLFYKVRLKKGVFAYILDTEVKGFRPSTGSGGISGRANGVEKNKRNIEEKEGRKKTSYDGYSVPYSKSYGLVFSSVDFGVQTKSGGRSSKETFFGLKLSGAGWMRNRIPLDVSILYSPSSPKLFDSFTQQHSGSMLFLEGAIPLEWKKGSNWSLYGSVGAVVLHYAFDITLGGEKGSVKETHLGYSLGLGGGMRFGRYLFKLELKYAKAGEKHVGSQLTMQRIF